MKRKNVYLELGVFSLKTIHKFYTSHKNEEWHFELFEPNPISIPAILNQIKKLDIPNVKLHPVAASTKEGKRDFYLGNRSPVGSTLFKGKGRSEQVSHMQVDCIDFNKWILDNLDKNDYIHMNMDIEGSEYEVLPHMIEGGSIYYINFMEVEFHSRKFKGENRIKFDHIHKEFKPDLEKVNAEQLFWRYADDTLHGYYKKEYV